MSGPPQEAGDVVADGAAALPTPALRPLVQRYHGYRYLGFAPGVHRGLPSPSVTVVLSLGPPTLITDHVDAPEPLRRFSTLVGGLGTQAVGIHHDGNQYGVQLDLTPLGARRLLGLPAGELSGSTVALDDVIGRGAGLLRERLLEAGSWPARFGILDAALLARARAGVTRSPAEPLRHAWHALVSEGGATRVGELAERLGWSRRTLGSRFVDEFGVTPKQLARIVRFDRSKQALATAAPTAGGPSLADVAVACGFYDQAHLAREWVALAGCPPSAWLRGEDFPIVQAGVAGDGSSSAA